MENDIALERTIRIKVDASSAEKAVNNLDKDLNKLDKTADNTNKSFGKLKATVIAVAAVLQARVIIGYSEAWKRVNNQLLATIPSTQTLASAQEDVVRIAKDARAPLEGVAKLYGGISAAANELNVTQNQVAKFTELASKSIAVQSSSAGEAAGALLQLRQAIGGTVIQAQEFNSLIDGARPLLEAVANGSDRFGGSVNTLREEVRKGTVTSKEFFEAALAGADIIDKRFNATIKTLSQSFQEAENNAIQFIGSSDQITNTMGFAGEAVIALSENLDLVVAASILATGVIGGKLVGALQLSIQKKIEAAKASTVLAATELRASKSALRVAKRTDEATLKRLESIKLTTSAAATEARINLVALKSSKEKAVEDVIAARTLNAKAIASVKAAEAEVILAAAESKRVGNTSVLIAAEAELVIVKKASELASKSLISAETSVSAASNNLATSKTAAATAAAKLAAAKLASSEAGKKLTITNSLVVTSTKKMTLVSAIATKTMKGLRGAMAFLGGPLGVVLTAATAISLFATSADDARSPTEILAKEVEKLSESFSQLNRGQLDVKLRNATTEVNRLNAAILVERENAKKFGFPGIGKTEERLIKLREEAVLLRDALFAAGLALNLQGTTDESGLTGIPEASKEDNKFVKNERLKTASLKAELNERLAVQRAFNGLLLADSSTTFAEERALAEFNRQEDLAALETKRSDAAIDFEKRRQAILLNTKLDSEGRLAINAELQLQELDQRRIFELEKTMIDKEAAEERKLINQDEIDFRVETTQAAQKIIIDSNRNSLLTVLGFLEQFSGKSKILAKALVALRAAEGVNSAIINSQVAATRALAELGPIAGPPAAASMIAFGKISAGIIAANAALKIGGGGGGAGGGSIPSSSGSEGSTTTAARQEPIQQQNVLEFRGLSEVAAALANLDPGEQIPVEFAQRIVAGIAEAERFSGGEI